MGIVNPKAGASFIRSLDGFSGLSDELVNSVSEALTLPASQRGAALDDWRARALASNAELGDILTNNNMIRLSSVPDAVDIRGEFHSALLHGMQNPETAAATYAQRMAAAIDSPEQAAAFEANLKLHAENVNRIVAETASNAGITEAEVLRRLRNGAADDSSRTTEAEFLRGMRNDTAGTTARSSDPQEPSSPGLTSRITRGAIDGIRWPFTRNVTIGGAIALANAPLILATADQASGHKISDAAKDTPFELMFEKVLAFGTWASNTKASVPAYHIENLLNDQGHINRETDDPAAYARAQALIMAVSHAAIGQPYSAVMTIDGVDIDPDDVVAAYRKAEQDHPDASLAERGGIAFNALLADVEQQYALNQVRGDVSRPDTFQQSGNNAGTPGATLAERRRDEGGTDVEASQAAIDTVLGQARQTFSAVAEQGVELAQEKAEAGFFSKLFNPLTTLFFAIVGAVSHAIQKWAMSDSDIEERTSQLNADGERGGVVSQLDRGGLFNRVFDGPTQNGQSTELEPTS